MAAGRFLGDIIARYLGIGGATANSTNVLSVRGPATLLDGNTGGHQIKVNKANAAVTAGFLFRLASVAVPSSAPWATTTSR